ncbi:MAG TPA: mycothiol system anti-sigma-R factor [Acidimicrobiales bacterium]|nr:mycothiol system anti-sigma-R factor [Acidimicrobiales bacterium]
MKPHCEETLAELHTYLDGELTEEVRAKIAFHLEDCPPCGQIAVFEAELKAVIAKKCIDRVPEDLRTRILKACSEDPASA